MGGEKEKQVGTVLCPCAGRGNPGRTRPNSVGQWWASEGVDQKLLNGFLFFPGLRWKTIGKTLVRSTGGRTTGTASVVLVPGGVALIGGCCVRKKNKDNGGEDNGRKRDKRVTFYVCGSLPPMLDLGRVGTY